MASSNPQFDVLLGGSEDLPAEFSVRKFAVARAQEIAALTQAIEDPQRTGLVFQKLPKHMRRRVMSRSSKRLPRRLRETHMNQLRKSGLPPKQKRPSRKFRRRPKNLLLEYNRRQKKHVWLETHIWHAKRFHMIQKWGYKLANFPNDKSFRACYRATANHCLLQDISYYCCIELSGPLDQLLDKLQMLTSKECGFTFGAKAFLGGTREGSVMLFHKSMFPYGAIGRVNFLWKPLEGTKPEDAMQITESRTLWVSVHPAFYLEVLDEFISLFNFSAITSEDMAIDIAGPSVEVSETITEQLADSDSRTSEKDLSSPVKKKPRLVRSEKREKNVEQTKLATRNVPYVRTPKYRSGDIEMVLLKDTLNRFRLTGPLSQAALLEALHIASIPESEAVKIATKEGEESLDLDVIHLESPAEPGGRTVEDWRRSYYDCSQHKESWLYQKTLWQDLKAATSPAQLPPHSVLGLTIQDPRLQVPSKRTKAVPDEEAVLGQEFKENFTTLSPLASLSPIWDSRVRDLSTSSKLSTAEVAEIRSHNLVPGFVSEEFDEVTSNSESRFKSSVPILLIQRPGCQDSSQKRLGFASGWDVIMPAGWALPLWLALVFRGARAGGLRESQSLAFEAGTEPLFDPDTSTYAIEAEACRAELTNHHFRLPPDKRPNFIKLGITSPFICSWNVLVNEWAQSSATEDCPPSSVTRFFVLRDKKKLERLRSVVDSLKTKKIRNNHISSNSSDLKNTFSSVTFNFCLVPVTIHMCSKGSPADYAVICLPSEADIDIMSKNSSHPGPTEEPHPDQYHEERKELRIEHKKLLKRLHRKRVRQRLKQEDSAAMESDSESEGDHKTPKLVTPVTVKRKAKDPPPTKDISDKHAETMHALWLPKTENMKDSCSRTIIGFVTKGDFSFTESLGIGHGYVVLPALLQLVASCQRRSSRGNKYSTPWILVRNTTSLQYRFGIIQVQNSR